VEVGTLEVADSAAGTRTVDLVLGPSADGDADADGRAVAFESDASSPTPPVVAVHLLTGAA
jgi:hypothetical protein